MQSNKRRTIPGRFRPPNWTTWSAGMRLRRESRLKGGVWNQIEKMRSRALRYKFILNKYSGSVRNVQLPTTYWSPSIQLTVASYFAAVIGRSKPQSANGVFQALSD
jgi:hypothetical protein